MRRFSAILLCMLLAVAAAAEPLEVHLSPSVNLDHAGRELRRALDRFEREAAAGIPSTWSQLALLRGQSARYGLDNFLVLTGDGRLMAIDAGGPTEVALYTSVPQEAGPFEIIIVSTASDRSRVDLMLRELYEPELLTASEQEQEKPAPPQTRITGATLPKRLIVESEDAATRAFARSFLESLNKGQSPETAADLARRAVMSPVKSGGPQPNLPAADGRYVDPTNIFEAEDSVAPNAVRVTLHLVRGEEEALRELSSSWEYRSDGRANNDPPVKVRGGGGGADVSVGRPGDRFRGRLRALEANRRVSVEAETFVLVGFGSSSTISIRGPRGIAEAWVHARPVGRSQVEITLDHLSGDWSFLGSVNTRVRARDGQTLPIAKNTYRRTESQSSGVPIISGIPFLGPLAGRERTVVSNSSYCLYLTADFQ